MRAILILLGLAAGATVFAGDVSPWSETPSFHQKLHYYGRSGEPEITVSVTLADGKQLDFAPADVLTLEQLVSRLPKGTLKANNWLTLWRGDSWMTFSPEELKTERLVRYSLLKKDRIKIEKR